MTLSDRTEDLQPILDRMAQGDDSAKEELIERACQRLRRLARKMLRDDKAVARWDQTDDLLQNALLRLHRSLDEVRPESVKDFFHFAATQMRRELRDLFRRHYGPQRNAGMYLSDDEGTESQAPLHVDGDAKQQQRLEEQRELREQLHEQIDLLSDEHKEMFNLIHYLELSQAEVAEQLGVSVRTIKRKWRAAQLALTDQIKNESTE